MQLKKIFSALYNIDFIAAESLVEEPDIIISNTYQNRSAIYMSGAIDSLEIERLTKENRIHQKRTHLAGECDCFRNK